MQPQIPTQAVVSAAASVESAAHAAVAAAILPQTAIDDVSIRPKPMKPSLFGQDEPEAPPATEPPPATFMPPAPERVMRPPRMPRIEDLPLPARAMVEKQGQPPEHPEERRRSLMQRLAAVGLGRRAEEQEAPQAPRTARPMPQYQQPTRPSARQPEGRGEPVSEYARRPAPQALDAHGRPLPVNNSPEEDQLDIPAFLRRQAN